MHNVQPRAHTIRLLDAPGAALTVSCPAWCQSDHREDVEHGTYLEDFAHRGTEEALHVDLGNGDQEDILIVEITQYPFGSDLRKPTAVMWPTLGMVEGHMTPDGLCGLAAQLRQYASALEALTIQLEKARGEL